MVADISVDGILRLDFMNGYNTISNVSEKTLSVNGEHHSLELEGKLGCNRVVELNRLPFPPEAHSSLLRSVCLARKYLFEWWTWNCRIQRPFPILEQRTSRQNINAKKTSKVPVRFMNLSADANTMYVGNLTQASQVFKEGISSRG